MNLNRIKAFGRRAAIGATAVASMVALTAAPAQAANLSDSASYGWASLFVSWPSSSFQVNYSVAANDSVSDSYCAEGRVKFYDYNGSQIGNAGTGDCVSDNIAGGLSGSPSFYPYTVYAVSLELCRYHNRNGGAVCRPKKYTYR